jgi:hypothetical protein
MGGPEKVWKDWFSVRLSLKESREFVVIAIVSMVELKVELFVVHELLYWFTMEVENVDWSERDSNDPVGVFMVGTSKLDKFGELHGLANVTYVKLLLKDKDPADSKELMLPNELTLCIPEKVMEESDSV